MAELRMPAVDFFGMFSALGDTIEKAREEAATRRTLASLFGDMPQQQQAAPVAQPSPTISGPARQQSLPTFAAAPSDASRAALSSLGGGVMDKYDPNGPDRAKSLAEYVENGSVNGISPNFQSAALAFLNDNPHGVGIRSGFRAIEKQKELWDAAIQKYGSAEAARKWVAPPGASRHNHGVALDLSYESPQAREWAHKNAAAYGLNFPMPHEPWHVEPAGARGGASAQQSVAPSPPQQPAPSSPQSIAPAVASNAPQFGGVNPAMVKALVMNKGTRQIGVQLMQSMLSPKTSPYDFVTVGENMVRVNKQTGAAEVLPGLGKQVDPLDRSLKEVQLEKARRDLGNEDMERVQVNGQYYERKKGSNGAFQAVESLPVEKPKADPTTDMKNYEAAKAQGFGGSFVEYQQGLKKAGATSVNVGGGSDKQIFDAIDESAKAARAAATGLQSISEARRAVEGGGVFGSGADFRLGLRKVAALLGADNTKVVNTETFRAAIAPQIAATMKATVGSTQISNADREFAEKAAGGSITLDEQSIKRLLGIMEKAGNVVIQQHRDKMDAIYPNDGKFARERALFGVEAPKTGIAPGQSTTVNGIKIERIQ